MRLRKVMLEEHKLDFNKISWTQEQREECTKLLFDVKEIFDRGGVHFWIFFGTLLGIYRDKELIEWDVDADIAIRWEDFEGVLDREKEFENLGCDEYGVERDDFLTIYRNHIHCDVYFFKNMNKGRKHRGIILPSDTFSPKTDFIEWEGESWELIKNPEKCLEILYGSNWRVPNRNFRHFYNTVVKSEEEAF